MESLIKPRALEATFDQQPLTAHRAVQAAAALPHGMEGEAATAGAAVAPTEPALPAVCTAPDKAAARAGALPMEAEGQGVSVALSEGPEGGVVLSLALGFV